jgi:hypothetical protein
MARTVQAAVGGGGQSQVLTPLVAAVIHETTRITMMSKISLVMAGLATTLFVVVASDPGVAAAPQEPGGKPKSVTRNPGAPGEFKAAPAPVAKAPATVVADPRIPASARVLQARFEKALADKTRLERLVKVNATYVSSEDVAKTTYEYNSVIAEIESQRDDLRDENELMQAQMELQRVELMAALKIRDAAADDFGRSTPKSPGISRLELLQRDQQYEIEVAKSKVANVRNFHVRRRLAAFEALMKKIEGVDKPPEPAPR